MILSAEALPLRISRLQALLAYLDRLEPVELHRFANSIELQLRIERVVQLAAQAIIDIGETLLHRVIPPAMPPLPSHAAAQPPATSPREVGLLAQLVERGILPPELAESMADIPQLAEKLIHEHDELDPAIVWRVWRERRKNFSAVAAAYAGFLARNKGKFRS
jgi:uncharacterized protein YutE (UPF0331/DUF86 family)